MLRACGCLGVSRGKVIVHEQWPSFHHRLWVAQLGGLSLADTLFCPEFVVIPRSPLRRGRPTADVCACCLLVMWMTIRCAHVVVVLPVAANVAITAVGAACCAMSRVPSAGVRGRVNGNVEYVSKTTGFRSVYSSTYDVVEILLSCFVGHGGGNIVPRLQPWYHTMVTSPQTAVGFPSQA